jgi:hypothetical protein
MPWTAACNHIAPGIGVFTVATLTGALTLAGCATAPVSPASRGAAAGASLQLREAVAQPFRDLNLASEDAPAVLQRARMSAFRPPVACTAAEAEIRALDAALGPRPSTEGQLSPSGLASSAVRSVWRLPFRGVVRQLSGASARDRDQAAARRAGLLRRGYLEGWRDDRCPPAGPAPAQAATETLAGRAG